MRIVAVVCMLFMVVGGIGLRPGATAPENALTVGLNVDPTSLNVSDNTTAAFQSVAGLIEEQLIFFSARGDSIKPWLATDWKWVTPTTLEMHLRRNVTFSNGESMDAAAAKFSIDEFVNAKPYRFLLPTGAYKGTEVVDDHTIRVNLTRPYAPFVSFLARSVEVFPPKYYQQVGADAYGQHPIGTGPFLLGQWEKGDRIVLTRNPRYWSGAHPLSQVIFHIIRDDTARVAALERGEIDIAYLIPTTSVARLRRNQNIRVLDTPGLRKFAVHFDTTNGPAPLRDKRVRMALNLAVDKHALIARVYNGEADALPGQWLVPQEFGYNPAIHEFGYDPTMTKKLLAEAGVANGFQLQISSTVGRYPSDKEQAEVVANYLEQVGVHVIQRPLEYGAFLGGFSNHTIGTHLWGLLLSPDPHFNFSLFKTGSTYEFHPLGDEYNRLLDEGAAATDRVQRLKIYQRMDEIMHDDPPMLYLIVPRDVYGISARVTGFEPRSDQVLWLFNVAH